jgi:hypothetical protein
VLFLVVMVATIVGVDVAFLRHHLIARLCTNVAIVAAFGVLYALLRSRR